jgi:hypothetical protein
MSAPAGLYNIVADRGSTMSRTFLWKDPAKKPIHLAGYTARMQVRPTIDSETVILELTTENNRIELGETDGSVVLYIDADTTEDLEPDKYIYDLELIAPASERVYKLCYGNFVVRSEVTR